MVLVASILSLFVGFLIGGSVVLWVTSKEKPVGTLRIDESDPDGDYMFLRLNTPVDNVKARDIVQLKVEVTHCLSQD